MKTKKELRKSLQLRVEISVSGRFATVHYLWRLDDLEIMHNGKQRHGKWVPQELHISA